MNAKKQFLYSASVPARECWIARERGRSHYKIKTEMLPVRRAHPTRSVRAPYMRGENIIWTT